MNKKYNRIIKRIKKYLIKNKINKAVIGLSGGIDSALSLYLTAKAIGNKNVKALIMPEKGVSFRKDVYDAVDLCVRLKVDYEIIEINDFIKQFIRLPWKKCKSSLINLKARIRAVILYNYANANNALVIGTSNKTELLLGYFTKYGDGACDIEVIGSLYKTEVIRIGKELNLPESILDKKPSAGLYIGQTDEDELGGSYEDIDKILRSNKFNSKLGKKLRKRIEANKHKTEKIFVVK